MALGAVVMSSYHQTASLALALLLLGYAVIPSSIKAHARTSIIKTFFKPEILLLSDEEYHNQGVIETKKALNELKEYCKSPESSPWKTVSILKSPQR